MASWNLGKIFSVDEEHEVDAAKYVSGSESESDDEDAMDREAAFNKHKRNAGDGAAPVTGSNRSIRRYDEYGSFITRSERARAEKEALPPSAMKETKDGITVKGKGKVRFRGGFLSKGISDIKEIPEWTSEEKDRLFMTQANWESIDTDIDVTEMRWKNHIEGKIKFDEDNNTIRGIEDIIFNINNGKIIRHHRKVVLEEVVRQKTAGEYPNWHKLADISHFVTEEEKEKARKLAKEDEIEKDRVWKVIERPTKVVFSSSKSPKKKKGGLFGIFKKKSSK